MGAAHFNTVIHITVIPISEDMIDFFVSAIFPTYQHSWVF